MLDGQALLDALPSGAALVDATHRVIAANPRVGEDYARLGSPPPGCECSVDGPSPRCPVAVAQRTSESAERELRDPRSGGWLRVTAIPVPGTADGAPRFLVLTEDVTLRRELVAALHTGGEHQRALHALLVVVQGCTSAAETLGCLLEELSRLSWLGLGTRAAAFLRRDGRLEMVAHRNLPTPTLHECRIVPLGECLCGRVAQDGERIISLGEHPEHVRIHEAGEPHGHLVVPLLHDGRVVGVLTLYLPEGVALDAPALSFIEGAAAVASNAVAEQLAREEAATVRRSAETAERLSALGRLAAGVAHDFNNLLTVIGGYAQIASRHVDSKHALRPSIDAIQSTTVRAARLTRQLLTFGRKGSSNPRSVDLNFAVGDTERMLSRCVGEDVRIVQELEAGLWTVLIDPGHVEQILVNLAVNARDAMPSGGMFRIETMNVSLEEVPARFPEATPGRYVLLRVSDTGCGMSAEVLPRIFEPFFTTKYEGQGTGLGLSTVYGFVKQAGGHVAVESELGVGTTFEVLLPAVEGVAAEDSMPVKATGRSGRGERILVVEDDEGVRELLRVALSERGYVVTVVSDGTSALSTVAASPVFDLVLSDVVMPGLSGPQVAAKLRESRPDQRILLMSGHADLAASQFPNGKVPSTLLRKPIVLDDLLEIVRQSLDAPAA